MKFNYDRLHIDKALGNFRKSDNAIKRTRTRTKICPGGRGVILIRNGSCKCLCSTGA